MQPQVITTPKIGAMPPFTPHEEVSLAHNFADPLMGARCDLCNDAASDTRSQLQSEGWYLGHGEQFCPRCNTFA